MSVAQDASSPGMDGALADGSGANLDAASDMTTDAAIADAASTDAPHDASAVDGSPPGSRACNSNLDCREYVPSDPHAMICGRIICNDGWCDIDEADAVSCAMGYSCNYATGTCSP